MGEQTTRTKTDRSGRTGAFPTAAILAASGAVGAIAAVGSVAGCGSASQTPAVGYSVVLPEEAQDGVPGRADDVLSPGQRVEVTLAFDQLAAGATVVNPPGPAPRGVRWSDIPQAVASACNEAGIEMAILRTHAKDDDEYRFDLLTIETWPGELVIRRGEGDEVYRVVSVSVGRFPQMPDRVERGQKLVEAFQEKLRALGKVPKINERD